MPQDNYSGGDGFDGLPGTSPQDIETEQFALSCLLLEGDSQGERVDIAAGIVQTEDFARIAHQRIYAVILEIRESGDVLDIVVLRAHLSAHGWLEEAGDTGYLISLLDLMPSPANLTFYLEAIAKMAYRRRLVAFTLKVRGAAMDPATDPSEVARLAESLLLGTEKKATDGPTWRSAKDVSEEYVANLVDRMKTGNVGLSGLSTGLTNVDGILGGYQPGTLNIVAGRPSMGKTGAVLTIAKNMTAAGHPGALFLLEGTDSMAVSRLLSQIAQINSIRFQHAKLDAAERQRLSDAHKYLASLPMSFDDSSGITVAELRSRLRRFLSQYERIGYVVVDYLQIMRGRSRRSESDKRIEVLEIAQELKATAKEFKVPVIAVAQLNRGVERREDKRPLMSDLGESGQIEQEADTISFLYRPSYYAPKQEGQNAAPSTAVDEVEWIVAKNKEGSTGLTKLGFIPAYTQFVNLEERRDAGF